MAACFVFMWLHVNLELDQQNEAVDALGCGESAAQEQKDQTCVSWESRISCLWGVLTSWHMDRCVIAFFCWAGNRGPLVFDAAQYLLRHHFWPPTMSNEKKRALGHRAVDHWEDFQREHMRAKCKEAYFNPGLCILMLSVYPLSLSLSLYVCLSVSLFIYICIREEGTIVVLNRDLPYVTHASSSQISQVFQVSHPLPFISIICNPSNLSHPPIPSRVV